MATRGEVGAGGGGAPGAASPGSAAARGGPGLEATWPLRQLGVDHRRGVGDGVRVAILDTGVELGHPCFDHLRARGALRCRSFVPGASAAEDDDGHGTAMASLVAGGEVDGRAIGAAPGVAMLLIGRVGGGDGAPTRTLVRGVLWAAAQGADVVVMPVGVDHLRRVRQLVREGLDPGAATVQAARERAATVGVFRRLAARVARVGCLLVACTGNDARQPKIPGEARAPSAAPGVLAVGATQGAAPDPISVAAFSNAGADVLAPGTWIPAATPGGGVDHVRGTSAAAALAGGVVALWVASLRRTRADVPVGMLLSTLRDHAVPIAGVPVGTQGAGLLQAPPG